MVSPCRTRKEELVARALRRAADAGGGEPRVVVVAAPMLVVKPVMLVTLKVQDTQRRVVERTMRRTDKLQGLMDHYYDVVCSAAAGDGGGGTRGAGRFVFDGRRLKGEYTPEDLDMASGDVIDFFEDLMSG